MVAVAGHHAFHPSFHILDRRFRQLIPFSRGTDLQINKEVAAGRHLVQAEGRDPGCWVQVVQFGPGASCLRLYSAFCTLNYFILNATPFLLRS